jgi:TRAP-type mannitol/chloroaromatic compound transport system permease small subunit
MTAQQRKLVAAVLVVIGVLAFVVAVIYFTVEAKSLPSVLGQIHGATGHRTKHGIGAAVIGGLLLLAGAGLVFYRPRRY